MKTVVFFIGSLQLGGTEAKLARNILPQLKKRGKINPKLLLLQQRGEFLKILPDDIESINLGESSRTNLIDIIPRFKDAIQSLNADIVVSCMWYPAIISYLGRKLRLAEYKHIVHDTVNMTEYVKDYFRDEKYKNLKLYLTKKAYIDSDYIMVVSYGEKNDLIENFKIPKEKIQVIYNPLNTKMITEMALEVCDFENKSPTIVSVDRLVYQKGFDILFKAFKKVLQQVKCNLLIIGEGNKRDELFALAQSLNIHNNVLFTGFQQNPFKYMKSADIFCLASRYEGLGNVILEAMALGLPIIATDCPSGPAEILDNDKYGMLVPPNNPDALAEALLKVLSDNKFRESLSELALKRAQDFNIETSLKQWENTILGFESDK